MKELWWPRWFARHFPRQAYRRLFICNPVHRGPMYDGYVCLHCGSPWFFYRGSPWLAFGRKR